MYEGAPKAEALVISCGGSEDAGSDRAAGEALQTAGGVQHAARAVGQRSIARIERAIQRLGNGSGEGLRGYAKLSVRNSAQRPVQALEVIDEKALAEQLRIQVVQPDAVPGERLGGSHGRH